jgi:diguanylate cyclase (GGDEF)-like protein
MSGWQRITDLVRGAVGPRAQGGRIARRVVGLFIVSAIVPLALCAAILFRQFSAELGRSGRQSLDDLIRSFGMTVIARLDTADDELAVIAQGAKTDEEATQRIARLSWVRGLARVEPDRLRSAVGPALPSVNDRQKQALQRDSGVVLSSADAHGRSQVYVIRALPSRAWLYVVLDRDWLWGDASEFADDTALLVLDEQNRVLASAGAPLPQWARAAPLSEGRADEPSTGELVAEGSDRWMRRSWEMFLAGRFASPSWHVLAMRTEPALMSDRNSSYLSLCGLILVTILLITWLSLTSIRRQLHPLGLLREATERVAHRDFKALSGLSWNDEFGDLARSFDAMSSRLEVQFAALETLAEVDRLLLSAPELELILDRLLPRIAVLLGCQSVSVLLFDADSDQHARAYDYCLAQPGQLTVRRTDHHVAALKKACEQSSPARLEVASAPYLALGSQGSRQDPGLIRLYALRDQGNCVGALCLGYDAEAPEERACPMRASDFADRLSLILANLGQSARLRHQANFDSLTGLQNRNLFSESMALAVADAVAREGLGAVLYIDLDHFKRVNDTAGHDAGDSLLRVAAQRLKACGAEGCSIARLGGDEFAVLLPSVAAPAAARMVAERILLALQSPIEIGGREHHISASIGIAVFPADGVTLEALLRAADISMYHAKGAGRSRAVFFHTEMQRRLLERVELEDRMRRAVLHGAFELHYQPILDFSPARGLGLEALARWPRPDGPWIGPVEFIPVAEASGLIAELGEWILRRACVQSARWRRDAVRVDYISVNVSVQQLTRPGFVSGLQRILLDCGMRGDELQIEITESALAQAEELRDTLAGIVALGVRLALDDFGTGYSSLSYLRQYPIGTVKIDRSFVMGLPHEALACALVQSIVHMCAALGKTVVAEGIETEAQRDFLRRIGCHALQGYLLGRPMDAADVPGFAQRLLSGQNGVLAIADAAPGGPLKAAANE